MIERISQNNNMSLGNKKDKGNPTIKKEPIIIPKFLMKFSSTYFKRASDNPPQPGLQSKPTEKIKDKIQDRPENPKEMGNGTLRKRIAMKHGRSSSEIDYEKLLKAGKITNSSIYELINKNSEGTQQTQPNPTGENYAITIPTEIEEDGAKNKANNMRAWQTPIEVINFLSPDREKAGKFSPLKNHPHSDDYHRTINRSIAGALTLPPLTEKDPAGREHAHFHTRSRSLHLSPLPLDKIPGDMQVVYTPSTHDVKKVNEEKALENLDRSVVNCLICFDKMPDAVFMECGHGGICYECSLELWKNTGECFLCRHKIQQVLQIDVTTKNEKFIKVISSTQMVEEDRMRELDEIRQ